MRGSDPDGALFWLVTLLESGESPRFLARRLVILASEDVGLADPTGLLVAEAAARAVEFVGLPEARLTLAHATLALSLAAQEQLGHARPGRGDRRGARGRAVEVPDHLRGTGYRGAAEQGFGIDYHYPHDFPDGWVDQQYLPDAMLGRRFYDASRLRTRARARRAWRATDRPVSPGRIRAPGRVSPWKPPNFARFSWITSRPTATRSCPRRA